MSVTTRTFGTYPDGREVTLYTISNNKGMQIAVSDLGATLVSVIVPDKDGKPTDVVLGFDKAEDYLGEDMNGNGSFFGVVVGPSANRIAGAAFEIDGVSYHLDVNDNENNLHSHKRLGWHKRLWEGKADGNSVTFFIQDEDGNLGFPGKKAMSITYTLTEDNGVALHYHGTSDRKTIFNPTNHSYFNLEGHDSGCMEEQELWLGASKYTPGSAKLIPTGEIAAVAGTPMDFTTAKKIGKEIEADFEQLTNAGGYDHNWVIDDWDGTLRHFATVKAPKSGIVMEAFTTLPGVQFYAGNFVTKETGKNDAVYDRRGGLCLETQYFPDSVHNAQFPSCIFGGDTEYDSVTVYRFV